MAKNRLARRKEVNQFDQRDMCEENKSVNYKSYVPIEKVCNDDTRKYWGFFVN